MTQPVDLNEVRNRVLSNQQSGTDLPNSTDRSVFVDSEGNIILRPQPGTERQLSRVPQKTFAANLTADRQIVAQKLPNNTQEMFISGVTGWVYGIISELGDQYTMFAYSDGSLYQVMVLFPEVAGKFNQHDSHLFQDGRVCFGDEGGLPTLEQAYAKSVLWATGFSSYLRTGLFPFSINNV
ncbi:MAG: hypothetical protein QQW96_25545 [Tychonema bourrellyi B0820]|jgi:hypothetical protein|nr:hypothetical protein [Tychonema bourrellyi B0820]